MLVQSVRNPQKSRGLLGVWCAHRTQEFLSSRDMTEAGPRALIDETGEASDHDDRVDSTLPGARRGDAGARTTMSRLLRNSWVPSIEVFTDTVNFLINEPVPTSYKQMYLQQGGVDGRHDVSGGRRVADRRTAANAAGTKSFNRITYQRTRRKADRLG
jgi:hypothetical protein